MSELLIDLAAEAVSERLDDAIAKRVERAAPALLERMAFDWLERNRDAIRGVPGARGDTGPRGVAGPAAVGIEAATLDGFRLRLRYTNGSEVDLGDIRGAKGPRGQVGKRGPEGPRGQTGAAGEAGPAGPVPQFTFRGPWRRGRYSAGDIVEVTSGRSSGFYLTTEPTEARPPAAPWRLFMPALRQIIMATGGGGGGGGPAPEESFYLNYSGGINLPTNTPWSRGSFPVETHAGSIPLDTSGGFLRVTRPGVYNVTAFAQHGAAGATDVLLLGLSGSGQVRTSQASQGFSAGYCSQSLIAAIRDSNNSVTAMVLGAPGNINAAEITIALAQPMDTFP